MESDIKKATYVVIDTETARGAEAEKNRVCQIALIKTINEQKLETFDELVNPEVPIEENVTRIHGISNRDVQSAPKFSEIAEIIQKFVGDAVLVSHNTGFDVPLLCEELARSGLKKPRYAAIDTIPLCKIAYPAQKVVGYSLPKVAAMMGLQPRTWHNALADATVCTEVFWKCANKLLSTGVVRDVNQLINAGKNPKLQEYFNGRH